MKLNSGDSAPKTCTCCICDAKGKKLNTVSIKKGQTLPPTPKAGCYYHIAD